MNGNELIRKLKKLGYKPYFVSGPGKGSHGVLYVGNNKTTLKDRKKEIGAGLLLKMFRDLGLDSKMIK